MPLEGLRFLPKDELLTPAEFETVARAAVSVGFRKFRLTGGEPTLRLDLIEIVERLARVPGVHGLALTTNALLLTELAPALKRAGLNRINVHLDSLDAGTVERQMRWGSFEKIWRGIVAAEEAGLTPIKLNSVVTAGFNESDVVELARLTLERDWHVRFIELMPLGGGECATLSVKRYVSNIETRRRIETALGPLFEFEGKRPVVHPDAFVAATATLVGDVVVEAGATVTGSRIVGPAVIGAGSTITGSYIGPFTAIDADCLVDGSEIEYSIVLSHASISGVRRIDASLIGHYAEVTPASRVPRAHRLVLGDHSKVQISS